MRSGVDWVKLGESDFSRVVQVMVKRKYADTARVWAPDGRGGDDGIDVIAVDHHGDRHVFQIKYFSDGFSGDRKTTRKRQIKKSFDKACDLDPRPTEWTLVVPKQLTPGERKFVLELQAKEGPTPTISIEDPDDLDALIATMPDIHQYLVGDALAELMEQYHIESGPLIESEADLTERFAGLAKRADALNPNWGVDMHRVGEEIAYALRAKHPTAAEDDPVTVRFKTSFGPDDTTELEAFTRSMKFGARGPVRLPGKVVPNIVITSSHPLFNADIDNPELVLTAHSVSSPRDVEFRFKDSTGAVVASQDGILEHASHGFGGISSAFRVLGRIELDTDFEYDRDADGGPALKSAGPLRLSYDLSDIYPDEAIRAIEFLTLIANDELQCEVLIEDQSAFKFSAKADLDYDLAIIGSAAYDLSVIQKELHQRFKLPAELSRWLRINMRVARGLFEGLLIQSPLAGILTIELHADADRDEVREWLTEGAPFQAAMDDFTLEVGNRKLQIPGVRAFTQRGKVINPDDVAAALDSDSLAGCSVQIRAADHRFFHVYKTDRAPDVGAEVQLAWWSLPGINQPGEPPELADELAEAAPDEAAS